MDLNEREALRLQCITDASDGEALVIGDERKPVFGEWMRGIYAGMKNPQRDGMYVETIRRSGRMNHGTWYRLTDGKGKFWEYESRNTVFLQPNDELSRTA